MGAGVAWAFIPGSPATRATHHWLKYCPQASQPIRWLKVLAADPVDPVCAQTFADNGHKLVEKKLTREQLLEQIGQYDGLVVRSGVKVTEDVSAVVHASITNESVLD